jgi:hypothetical protein
VLVLSLLGCGEAPSPKAGAPPPEETAAPEAAPPTVTPLDAPRLARRLSIDLRGVLPTVEELDRVEADPAALSALRDAYLEDPLFEEQMVALYQERWLTAIDTFRTYYYDHLLEPRQAYAYNRSIGEEPIRLIAHVIATDTPYTEIVTADWTMATELTGAAWPLAYPEGQTGWQVATYTDSRPHAGVLSTNGMWLRYFSPMFNYNRGRTAAIFNLLTCEDFLNRPVQISGAVSLLDGSAEEAIRTNPTCIACHAAIEPVAATLFGFIPLADQNHLEMERYHPEREYLGESILQVESAWFGTPVDGLADLGRAIALDPRFVSCGVETMTEGLLRRPTGDDDFALLEEGRAAFIDSDLNMKVVIRHVTDSPAYQAGALTDEADAEDEVSATTRRLIVSHHARSILQDLSGFTWTREGAAQLDDDVLGVRVLGGGADGDLLSAAQQTPGLTWALTTQRVAEAAGIQIADRDLVVGSEAPLLVGVTLEIRPGDAAFDAALEALWWRLMAIHPSEADKAELTELWSAAFSLTGTAEAAWAAVITVALRDPAFLSF